MKDTTQYIALLFTLSLIGLCWTGVASAGDNHVHVEQVAGGDNFNLEITQIGFSQMIQFSFDHANNDVNLLQQGNNMYIGYTDAWGSGKQWGGDLDGVGNEVDVRQKCSFTTCNDTDFQFHIWGDDNQVVFGQGYENNNSLTPNWNYDGYEPGGNYVRLDIHGDDNKFKGSQKQDSSSITHSIIAAVYGDNNDVYVRQMQNGNKSLNLTINSDWNEASIVQKKAGAHTATINLTGTEPTTLNLTQSGDTNQSYSLTQNCVTVGGCSVSITQGN